MKITYLAGGFKRNWQQKVIDEVKNVFFRNPRLYREDKDPKSYWARDKSMIEASHLMLVNVEKDNPGIGLFIEAGFAYGLGKKVWTVLPKEHDHINIRYVKAIVHFSDRVFDTLDDAIVELQKL